MKKCSKCLLEKNIDEFIKGVCKSCKKAYKKEYYIKNKDMILRNSREYYSENREMVMEKVREYYSKNKERKIEYQNNYFKNRIKTDILYKIKYNIRGLISVSLRNEGYKKKSKTNIILGCGYLEFKTYIESKFESWMTWENHGLYNGELDYGWDIDHIVPISKATTEEELIKLNHYTNLQPLCSKINRDIKRNS
jgi:hypothetical protein